MTENNDQDISIEDGEYEDVPESEMNIFADKTETQIRTICEKFDKKKIIVDPEFQRFYVWGNKPEIKSRLIESVLLNIPIPIIYTSEIEDGREEVIDGQQRITTFHAFKNNEFKLFGLEMLKKLNGKKYNELPDSYQDRFLDRGITIIKIRKEGTEKS